MEKRKHKKARKMQSNRKWVIATRDFVKYATHNKTH